MFFPENTQIRLSWSNKNHQKFLVKKLDIFGFLWSFSVSKIWGCWFQLFFVILGEKYPKNTLLLSNLSNVLFFFFFFEKFCNLTNLRMLISNMAITFLKFQLKNRQVRYFFSQVKAVLFLEICRLDKFEGADFKYDNNFLKIYPKNIEIRYFLPQI